uniref:Small ribosomal subunit protein mS26 n=1 Tax=Schistocephalus solidus TaxID=70667 RepID=A0A0X3Q0L5_SCHSO
MSSVVPRFVRSARKPIFRRNPRIYPPTKGKMLRVRQPTPIDPVEDNLLKKWWSDYKLQTVAIGHLLRSTFALKSPDSLPEIVVEQAFDPPLVLINDAWNCETKKLREEYFVSHFSEKIMETLTKRQEYDDREKARVEELKRKFLSMLDGSDRMVTIDNIDSRLDEVMHSQPLDFNYAVDSSGRPVKHQKPSTDS